MSRVAHVDLNDLSHVTVPDLLGHVPSLPARRMLGVHQGGSGCAATVISCDINHRWRAGRRGKSFPAHRRVVFYVSI